MPPQPPEPASPTSIPSRVTPVNNPVPPTRQAVERAGLFFVIYGYTSLLTTLSAMLGLFMVVLLTNFSGSTIPLTVLLIVIGILSFFSISYALFFIYAGTYLKRRPGKATKLLIWLGLILSLLLVFNLLPLLPIIGAIIALVQLHKAPLESTAPQAKRHLSAYPEAKIALILSVLLVICTIAGMALLQSKPRSEINGLGDRLKPAAFATCKEPAKTAFTHCTVVDINNQVTMLFPGQPGLRHTHYAPDKVVDGLQDLTAYSATVYDHQRDITITYGLEIRNFSADTTTDPSLLQQQRFATPLQSTSLLCILNDDPHTLIEHGASFEYVGLPALDVTAKGKDIGSSPCTLRLTNILRGDRLYTLYIVYPAEKQDEVLYQQYANHLTLTE